MNSSAQNASRKWANGAFRRIQPAMVTVAVVALLFGMPGEPAMAAKASRHAPWDDLLKIGSPPERGHAREGSRHAAVPLPKPRPAEAPSAERDKADQDKPDREKPDGE